jgi:SAM-dependent methyltransferase
LPCASYSDPRLTAVYDPLNPAISGLDFFRDLAGETPKTILEMGCGTGRLACDLAARGHRVTGADPATAMLDVARGRPGGGKVRWVEADAAGFSDGTRYDLIIMTGHAFQVLLGDREVRATLGNFRRHLAAGGRLAFEARNPEMREWDSWIPEETREQIEVPGLGWVEVHYDIASDEGQLVTFETHFRFAADDIVVAPHTLRFMGQAELAAFLAGAGFKDVAWYGNWDRSALTCSSPEIIAVAR